MATSCAFDEQKDQDALIVIDLMMPALISSIFLVFLFYRFYKLRNIGTRNKQKINSSLGFRISLLTVILVCDLLGFIFTWSTDEYIYSKDQKAEALNLVEIFTIILQIIFMVHEFNLYVPLYFVHKLYWIVLFIWIIITIIAFAVYNNSCYKESYNYVVFVFRLIALALLNFYSLYIRKQDIYEFEELQFLSTSLPEQQSSAFFDSYREKSVSNIYLSDQTSKSFMQVTINKEWSVIQEKGDMKVVIKMDITLINSNISYKIKKTLDEFQPLWNKFQQDNKEYFDQNPVEFNEYQSIVQQLNQSNNIQQSIQLIIRFVQKISLKIETVSQGLLDFFEIPHDEQVELKKRKNWKKNGLQNDQITQNSFSQMSANQQNNKQKQAFVSNLDYRRGSNKQDLNFIQRTQSETVRDDRKMRATTIYEKSNINDKNKDNTEITEEDGTKETEISKQFFIVKILSSNQQGKQGNHHIEYEIEIKFHLPTHEQPRTWIINKRYTDFFELDQTLKVFLGFKNLPPLPSKKINMDEKAVQDRVQGFEYYLKSLLDDKIYHHYALFKFIELKKEWEEEFKTILKNVEATENFNTFQAICKGHELVDSTGRKNKPFVRYNFKIVGKNGEQISQFSRRFSEFLPLHQQIKNRFSKHYIQDLPSKYTKFGGKTTKYSREGELTTYLNQLLKIPNINYCVPFKQFINYNNKNNDTNLSIREPSQKQFIIKVGIEPPIEDMNSVFKTLDDINDKDEKKLDEMISKRNQ